ncbi:MAG: hypothetical protein KDC53_14395 [Saprospiraceae bacterium]|nr:hypothetical protein [Saprospiraceae bacterium]
MIIDIYIGNREFRAEVFHTVTGKAIMEKLPLSAVASTWGDEIYFPVPVQVKLEPGAKADVEIGDLAYWPTMPAFCIFFGPTPASVGDAPRAASAVNVFGRLIAPDLDLLRSTTDGEKLMIIRAHE